MIPYINMLRLNKIEIKSPTVPAGPKLYSPKTKIRKPFSRNANSSNLLSKLNNKNENSHLKRNENK